MRDVLRDGRLIFTLTLRCPSLSTPVRGAVALVAPSVQSTRATPRIKSSRRTTSAAERLPIVAARPGRAPLWWVLAACLLLATVLTLVVAGTAAVSHDDPYLTGRVWLDGWFHGDAVWYSRIAEAGYFYRPGQQSSIAFFPVFPMLLRGVGSVLNGNYEMAGSLTGVVAGAAAALAFTMWVWTRFPRAEAVTAIAVLLVYPYSFFLFGAGYSDGLFLLTAVGAFVLLEHRMFWLAGFVGAFATAGRPVGVAVAIGLLVRMFEIHAEQLCANGIGRGGPTGAPESWGVTAHPLTPPPVATGHPTLRDLLTAAGDVGPREAGVLLSAVGVAGWCAYLWWQFGDPLAFVAVQAAPGWDQGSGPATWLKFTFIETIGRRLANPTMLLTAQALAALAAVLMLGHVRRRLGWGYMVYSFLVLAIPIVGTKDFMGVGRYVLAAFPVFAVAGGALALTRPYWVRILVLGLSGGGLILLTALFAHGVEVS